MNYLVFAIVVKTTETAASLDEMTLYAINKPRCDCGRKNKNKMVRNVSLWQGSCLENYITGLG